MTGGHRSEKDVSKMAKTSKEALESVTVEISTDGDASTQSIPCSQSQDSIIGTSPVHCGNSSQPHASGMTSGGSTRALSVSKGSPEDAAAPEDPAAAEDGCLGRNESPNLSMSRSAKPQRTATERQNPAAVTSQDWHAVRF